MVNAFFSVFVVFLYMYMHTIFAGGIIGFVIVLRVACISLHFCGPLLFVVWLFFLYGIYGIYCKELGWNFLFRVRIPFCIQFEFFKFILNCLLLVG